LVVVVDCAEDALEWYVDMQFRLYEAAIGGIVTAPSTTSGADPNSPELVVPVSSPLCVQDWVLRAVCIQPMVAHPRYLKFGEADSSDLIGNQLEG